MRLSTTINFFIIQNDGTTEPYKAHVRRYHKLGYKALDAIFCGADGNNSPLMDANWERFVHDICDEAEKLGIKYCQGHLPYYADFAQKNDTREEAIRRSLLAFGKMGVQWAATHPGSVGAAPESKIFNREYFAPHIEFAKRQGVGIALENIFDSGNVRHYCGVVEELVDLVDSFNDPAVGVCWDFGHGNIMYPKSQAGCLRTIGSRLKMTHVHDNNGKSDQHLPPFFGNINWEEVVQTLREVNYTGAFSFEVVNHTYKISETLMMSEWAHVKAVGDYLLK